MSNDVVLPGTGANVEADDQGGTEVTNATTASGNPILHFAATPSFVAVGMLVTDETTGSVIPDGTKVLSFDGTSVTMDQNATGAGVGNGDTIRFSALRQVVKIGGTGGAVTATGAGVLTRTTGVTPYAANNSVSDNATAGSVSAMPIAVSDKSNDPVAINAMSIITNDTGAAGKSFRVYLYNSDPTASSGVQAGDHAAFSNKSAGFIGTLVGTFRAMSGGSVARLTPEDQGPIIANPGVDATTIWWQLQALEAFTPVSASVWTPTVEKVQLRA